MTLVIPRGEMERREESRAYKECGLYPQVWTWGLYSRSHSCWAKGGKLLGLFELCCLQVTFRSQTIVLYTKTFAEPATEACREMKLKTKIIIK